MKVLSVSEFSAWNNKAGCRGYTFDMENNSRIKTGHMHACLCFRSMRISTSYDRILFFSELGSMVLDSVKEVRMFENSDGVGTYFDIVCGMDGPGRAVYRIIAD